MNNLFEYTMRFIWELYDTLQSNIVPIFDFMNNSVTIGSFELSIYEIIFGGGLLVVMGIRVFNWATSLIVPN